MTEKTNTEFTENLRDDFERQLLDSNEYSRQNLKRWNSQDYIDWKIDAMWKGFLMAREPTTIILPTKGWSFSLDWQNGYNDALDQCAQSIEAQGYMVKKE